MDTWLKANKGQGRAGSVANDGAEDLLKVAGCLSLDPTCKGAAVLALVGSLDGLPAVTLPVAADDAPREALILGAEARHRSLEHFGIAFDTLAVVLGGFGDVEQSV